MVIVNRSTFLRLVVATIATATFAWAQPVQADDPVVVMKTNLGTIEIQLDPKNAPVSTANFLAYVDKKFYDNTVFHRVVRGFVAQGGGFTADGQEKPTDPPIKNEARNGLHNTRGTISMARTSDPDSATSQFFLNFVDNSSGKLDPGGFSPDGYAVFGKITKGLDVLEMGRPRARFF
jgi:peptidyl-prolyl cis-trans isomerase A (cyclophilin A)